MRIFGKINSKAATQINTGFGSNNEAYGGRFVNKNGKPNVHKTGLSFFERVSWFHTLLQVSTGKFLALILVFFIGINLLFALVYYCIGVDHLGGMQAANAMEKFGEAYFFSAQTFTTVGYGRINPTGLFASAVASFEALLGLLTFAIATGLFYARFSKPRAFIKFSSNAVLAPFKEGVALMIRIAPYKNNNLTDAEVKLMAGIAVEEDGKKSTRFYPLELEYNNINALTLSWTVVHPINENSPFYNFSIVDFSGTEGEILVFVKAFDDMYSNTVVARSSYTFKEIIAGAKFIPIYHRNESGTATVIEIDKLNAHAPAAITHLFGNR